MRYRDIVFSVCFLAFTIVGCSTKNQDLSAPPPTKTVLTPDVVKVEESERVNLVPIEEKNLISRTIVVVLPESKSSDQILNGATLALNDSQSKETALVFMNVDKLVEYKLRAASAILIGFSADKVPGIMNIAYENNIPVICLSKCKEKNIGNLYALRDRVEDEVLFITGHAVSEGMTDIAILAPGGAHSDKFVSEIAQQVPLDKKSEEKGKKVKFEVINYNDFTNLSKLRDFNGQAIVIIAKGNRLTKILEHLNQETVNLNKWQILGLSHWLVDPATKSHPALSGAWCCSIGPLRYISFQKDYFRLFNKDPGDMAFTTYDMVSFLIENIGDGSEFDKKYDGIFGVYRFYRNKGGETFVERIHKIETLSPSEEPHGDSQLQEEMLL